MPITRDGIQAGVAGLDKILRHGQGQCYLFSRPLTAAQVAHLARRAKQKSSSIEGVAPGCTLGRACKTVLSCRHTPSVPPKTICLRATSWFASWTIRRRPIAMMSASDLDRRFCGRGDASAPLPDDQVVRAKTISTVSSCALIENRNFFLCPTIAECRTGSARNSRIWLLSGTNRHLGARLVVC
jgi:hypothetical protein